MSRQAAKSYAFQPIKIVEETATVSADPRQMNDDRVRNFSEPDREIAFVCECTDPTCRRTVVLTAAQYEALRPGLVLHDSHR